MFAYWGLSCHFVIIATNGVLKFKKIIKLRLYPFLVYSPLHITYIGLLTDIWSGCFTSARNIKSCQNHTTF